MHNSELYALIHLRYDQRGRHVGYSRIAESDRSQKDWSSPRNSVLTHLCAVPVRWLLFYTFVRDALDAGTIVRFTLPKAFPPFVTGRNRNQVMALTRAEHPMADPLLSIQDVL